MAELPESIKRLNKIYSDGFAARLADKNINPFKIGTTEYDHWLMGWEDQDEHLTHRDEALRSIGWFG